MKSVCYDFSDNCRKGLESLSIYLLIPIGLCTLTDAVYGV